LPVWDDGGSDKVVEHLNVSGAFKTVVVVLILLKLAPFIYMTAFVFKDELT
jgi:hypothetical protein